MIMDGAGWHKSHNLKMPKNIQKVLLPPYCPELNPVERLWQYIKNNTIKNKVFETIGELEDELCRFVNCIVPLSSEADSYKKPSG